MSARTILALCAAIVAHAPSSALGAQDSDARPAVGLAVPGTPAGAVLRAWLEAFQRADTARMGAYDRRDQLELRVASELPWRRAVNPITETNWEAVGATPDVKAARDALAVTQVQLLSRLRDRAQP